MNDQKPYKLIKTSKPELTIDKEYTQLNNSKNNTITSNFRNENEKNEKYCTDISLSRLFLHKRNNYYTEKGLLKQICISPKDIVSNVNESYDYLTKLKLQKNMINKKINSKIQNTINRFENYKDKCKEISRSLTRNHQRVNNTNHNSKNNTSYSFYQNSKVKEMGALLSNNTVLKNENQFFKNLVRELKFYFAEDYDIISEYFKINSNLIKNEGRQIKLFNIAFDLVEQIIEIYEEKNIKNIWDTAIELYNALFEDFRDQLSFSSLNRANFLYKLWNAKQEQIDKKIQKINESINDSGIKMESLNEKNSHLLEEIKILNGKNHKIEGEKFNLKNENERLKLIIPEKDKRIEDLEHIITDLNEDLQKRINAYSDLLNKYNARMKGKKMFKVQRSISQLNFEDDSSSKISSDSDLNNSLSKNNEFPIKKMSTKIEKKNSFNQPIMEKRRFAARNSVFIEDQRRNQILRGVINKVKKKDNESSVILNQPLETIKYRPSIFQRDLKSKIKQTTDIINEFQKFESNPNIFSENIEIEKPNVIEVEKKNENNEKKEENKEIVELDLYMNKGVEIIEKYKDEYIQTDITGSTNDDKLSNNILKDLIDFNGNNEEIKKKMNQFMVEYELKVQEVIKLREDLEKTQDNNEQIVETYTDMFSSLKETLKNSNKDINNFLNENENRLKEKGEDKIISLFKTLVENACKTINENKVSEMYDFGPEYVSNIRRNSISSINLKDDDNDISSNINTLSPRNDKKKNIKGRRKSSIIDFNKIQQVRTKAFQKRNEIVDFNTEKFNYESIYLDYLGRKKEIKLSMTLRKTLRIVDSILFDFIEQAYFRKNKLNFSRDERYIDFGEAVYFYFLKSFGVEKLVQKKYIGFLRGLFEYENEIERIKIFLSLLQIKRFEFNERKKTLYKKNSTDDDNFTEFYSNFVSRQIILTIQFLRVNNFIIKTTDEQGIPIVYIKYNRLSDNLISHFSNFHISQDIKDKIVNGIEKNKINVDKILHSVVLFEKLIKMLINIFIVYEHTFSNTLKIIFRSFCHDDKLNKLEYLTINEYLLGHRVSFELLNKLFSIGKETKMDFERFETNVIELDNLDMIKFNQFSNINIDKAKKVLLNLKEIIEANQLTIFDKIINRLKLVKYKQLTDFFIEKCNKVKILISSTNDEDFDVYHFLAIKLLDQASLFLYQDNKITEIFGNLEKIYNLISIYNPSETENYLLSYIRNKNLK